MSEALEIIESIRALGADVVIDLKVRPASKVPDELIQRAADHADEIRALITQAGAVPEQPRQVASPDVQIENMADHQNQRGPYWVWPNDALARLRAKLIELGPGAELVPTFARSCGVKLPNGRFILIDRDGRETKG